MYQKTELKNIEQPIIKRIADSAFIPFDPANSDYQEYLKWIADGNEPLPAESGTEE